LELLENDTRSSPDVAKVRRTAEEAFLLLGIESLCIQLGNLAQALCIEHLGSLVSLIPPDRFWEFAICLGNMREAECDRLRAMIIAYDCYGRDYKRHLVRNQDWMRKALIRRVDLGPWFSAESQSLVIGDRRLEITLVSELIHVFLMGTYFGTCLSLG